MTVCKATKHVPLFLHPPDFPAEINRGHKKVTQAKISRQNLVLFRWVKGTGEQH